MKRLVVVLSIFIVVIMCCSLYKSDEGIPEIIRIHIRASSNDIEDQDIKYKVKDEVSQYISENVNHLTSIEDASAFINENKASIKSIADKVLKENGFNYQSDIYFRIEEFPTREYDGITFSGGYYQSLIIELGASEGDNWWCVMYPPLCFYNGTSGDEFEYKSIVQEILDKIT